MGWRERKSRKYKRHRLGEERLPIGSLLIRDTPMWALSTHWVKRYFTTARKHRKEYAGNWKKTRDPQNW